MDGHADPEGEGGLALVDGLAAVLAVLVGRDPVAGVESVEGLLGLALWVGAVDIGVAVAELVGQAGVVVAVAGVQVGAETAGDLVGGQSWNSCPPRLAGVWRCFQLREVEEGCERASQSLTLAAELRHGVSIDCIRKLERQLPPSHRSPAVRRLREQLAAVA